MTWGDRFEDGLVHLGDYPEDGEALTQEEYLTGTRRGQDAQRTAVPVSMSAGGSRAETREAEQSAQPQWSDFEELERAWHQFTASVYAALAAVLSALVGRTPWTRKTARERATRPRSR